MEIEMGLITLCIYCYHHGHSVTNQWLAWLFFCVGSLLLVVFFFVCWGCETPMLALACQKPEFLSAKMVLYVYTHCSLPFCKQTNTCSDYKKPLPSNHFSCECPMRVDMWTGYDYLGAKIYRFLASQCYNWSFTSSTQKNPTNKTPTKPSQRCFRNIHHMRWKAFYQTCHAEKGNETQYY